MTLAHRLPSNGRPPGAGALLFLMTLLIPLLLLPGTVAGMSSARLLSLREEARAMFRHGWDPYMAHAFPEDEIKPMSCTPHHRDRADARNIGRNDPLGEFSLTAIDTLSALAVMAASDVEDARRFWDVVREIARIYWYNEPKACGGPCGNRTSSWGRFQGRAKGTRGFDIDAKVQVFETTIRVLGGLLSAHQFATNALPSLPAAYHPPFEYRDELLHLAEDLGQRLLPALTESPTGIPYPRINLRHGLPHGVINPRYYACDRTPPPFQPEDSPEHDSENTWKHPRTVRKERPEEEVTETCTAGAGSLVLEFTTLSRLTGNPAFEAAAKKAFNAVWSRRSTISLLGTGINAESGLWEGANSGIGAGADSFYEYAFKSYVFLGGDNGSADEYDDGYFLDVWEQSREALEHHAMVSEPATWWNNVHLATGAGIPGAQWIDSLGAFWSGTLVGAGSIPDEDDSVHGEDGLEVGVRANLVYAALWSRYAALPERYNTRLSTIDSGLSWYPGRPEFIESTYLLYRATKDPFYLYVGEMVMQDLKRRCRTKCGWAGLQDVRTGERADRMESFWLSETWMYLFLLFDEDNELHKFDAPWVFTTEGHPLILPRSRRKSRSKRPTYPPPPPPPRTCLAPASSSIFSAAVSRPDFFHPAYFTRLHLLPSASALETSSAEVFSTHQSWSPTNSSYYPWTLPRHLIPPLATSAPLPTRDALELMFPEGFPGTGTFSSSSSSSSSSGSGSGSGSTGGSGSTLSRFAPKIARVDDGVRILSLDALRLSLVKDASAAGLRVSRVGGVALGKGEKVFVDRGLVGGLRDPNFEAVWDEAVLDLIFTLRSSSDTPVDADVDVDSRRQPPNSNPKAKTGAGMLAAAGLSTGNKLSELFARLGVEIEFLSSAPSFSSSSLSSSSSSSSSTLTVPAAIALGPGAIPPADSPGNTPTYSVYVARGTDATACHTLLPREAAEHEVVVVQRGGCTFADKIANVPDSPGVKVVVVVDYYDVDGVAVVDVDDMAGAGEDGAEDGGARDDEGVGEREKTGGGAGGKERAAKGGKGRGKEKRGEKAGKRGAGGAGVGGWENVDAGMITPEIDLPQRNFFGRNRRNRVGLVMLRRGAVDWDDVERVGVRRRVRVRVAGVGVGGLEVT